MGDDRSNRYDPEEWVGSPGREDDRGRGDDRGRRKDTRGRGDSRSQDRHSPDNRKNSKLAVVRESSRFTDQRGPVEKGRPNIPPLHPSSRGSTAMPGQISVVQSTPTIKVNKPDFIVVQFAAVHVPNVIGPRGSHIQELCRLSGAEIRIDHQRGSGHATAVITGARADAARQLLCKHLEYSPVFPDGSILNM